MNKMSEPIALLESRSIITLAGPERESLLQGIITNNIMLLDNDHGLYAALLTPQGKYLHDFFLYQRGEVIYLDCEKERMPDLFRRLLMYRLRKNVEIIDQSEKYKIVSSNSQLQNENLFYQDPRSKEMGYRTIFETIPQDYIIESEDEYHRKRITLGIAEGSMDYIVDKSLILEGSFELLHGVDFKKGCYVGQEVTARMKYRGKVKKIMLPVTLSGPAPDKGTPITNKKGNKVGDLRSSSDKKAIALLRLNDIQFNQQYSFGDIEITPIKPIWWKETQNE
jgi:tRNA-modifying protein YgfZ